MSSDEDIEDYGFEYSSEDMSEGNVDIENQYYNSKGMIEGQDLKDALGGFKKVIDMEEDKGEWGFKAYKQIVKLEYNLGMHEDMLQDYKNMLAYAASAVTKNQAEKKINSLLDFMGTCKDTQLLQRFYELTLDATQYISNERLWFKTNLKLCDLWYQNEEFVQLARMLKQLHKACENEDGTNDLKKATLLLEVYAIEIQMYTAQRNYKKLKELYDSALSIKSAIPHPRVLGIIRECGGKMYMREKAWLSAHTEFFEAFKSYDDAGSARRVMCLKYLVLASMLMESQVDPFNAQETKPYRNDPQIQAMTDLVQAYQANDINKFERILRANRISILEDPFIRPYIEDLMTGLRTQVLTKIIGPYTRVRIPFLAQRVNYSEKELERLLASLILDGRIQGQIDQVNQLLILSRTSGSSTGKYQQLDKWADTLTSIQMTLLSKV